MGTMIKMRENTGVVLWILVFAFGVIWVLQDSGTFDNVGATTGDVAVVDGEKIPYNEYNDLLNARLQQYQSQTGESAPPQYVDLQRDQVFNALVDDRLRSKAMEAYGISVTDDEVYDMILGPEPHPFIQTNFSDGQGGINQALLQSFVDDPANRENLISIETYLRQQRRQQKLNTLLDATVRVSEEEIMDEHVRRSRSADINFAAFRYAAISNDSISVDESDLRAYYEDNREDYAQPQTFTLDYVSLSKAPAAEDTAAVMQDVERLRERFAAAENDSLFLSRNASERPYTNAFFSPADLDAAIANAVYSDLTVGRLTEPVMSGNQVHMIKITGVEEGEETFARARHILFRAAEGNEAARDQALDQAREIRQRLIDGEDFATLAATFSDDGSSSNGGDLGWFGEGRMVAPFEEAVFSAPIGRVTQPVETQFGYHLIEVTDRTDQTVQIADYAQILRASVATLSRAEERLGDIQYFAEESGDFTGEVERSDLSLQQVQVEADQQFIPGIGNSRALRTFMENAETGDVSNVIELNDLFIVAHLRESTPEGYRSFDEVRSEIQPRVTLEKKKAIAMARIERATRQHNDLQSIADALGVPVRSATGVTAANPVLSGLGREPMLVGTAFGLGEGTVSGALEGNTAGVVLQVSTLNEAGPLSDAERSQIRERLLSERRRQVQTQWIANLRDEADIEDNRSQFEM